VTAAGFGIALRITSQWKPESLAWLPSRRSDMTSGPPLICEDISPVGRARSGRR
jgi:hypothetical protein